MLLLALLLSITLPVREDIPYSWKDNNPVPLENLRVVEVPYYGFDGETHQGKLIVHEIVAEEILSIFEEVYAANYPIEKILFVDAYAGIDEVSAADNNSYSFCCRENTSVPGTFSKHSYGLAVDVNPFYNPYHKGNLIIPIEGIANLDRHLGVKGMIQTGDALHTAFTSRGWEWGGKWPETRGYADYHHFEKDPAIFLKN